MIWKVKPSREILDSFRGEHIETHLGIEITDVGDDYLCARMPVDERTIQSSGVLHGGAACVLAETLGSIGGAFCVDMEKQIVLGLILDTSHIRGVKHGYVTGKAKPLEINKNTQVWEIKIVDDTDQLVCISKLTLAVKDI